MGKQILSNSQSPISADKHDSALHQAVKVVAPVETKQLDSEWLQLLQEAMERTQPADNRIDEDSKKAFRYLSRQNLIVPEPTANNRRCFYEGVIRYHLVWAVGERLITKGYTFESFGDELNHRKSWWTSWKHHAPNTQQTALSLCSKHIGPDQVQLGFGPMGVWLAFRLTYMNWVRKQLAEHGIATALEKKDLKWTLSRDDYELLEWHRSVCSTHAVAERIAELASSSTFTKNNPIERWTRPFDIAALATEQMAKR